MEKNVNTFQFDVSSKEEMSTKTLDNAENTVILTATDPLEEDVYLWKNTFDYHIVGVDKSHESRSYLQHEHNLKMVRHVISNPSFILEDQNYPTRKNYIGMVKLIIEDQVRAKHLHIVTDESTKIEDTFEIVTIRPQSTLSTNLSERVVIYDEFSN